MAVVSINQASFIQKITVPEIAKIKQAGKILTQTVPKAFAENAKLHGSYALSNIDLYQTTVKENLFKVISNKSSVISVNVEYNQEFLTPMVGTYRVNDKAFYPYIHTSPFNSRFDPEDYRKIVNTGVAGKATDIIFHGNKPAWDNNGGYWDDTISQFPELVTNALANVGAISGGGTNNLKQFVSESYHKMSVYK